ncbi:MAG: hypothetical protein KBT19_06675 [Lachnospiraceae bacterium]|nr:hypothetical protein [Candidatus Colinaster equi]
MNLKWTLDHITKENGKWFAELRRHNVNGTSVRVHTGSLWGWNGMSYQSLKATLNEYYNIPIPTISELKLIRFT